MKSNRSTEEFDDAVGVNRQTDIGWSGQTENRRFEVLAVHRDPIKRVGRLICDHATVQVLQVFATGHFDDVTSSQLIPGLSHFNAVDAKVAVGDPLTGLRTRLGETDTTDHVV
jgi:hypothetical protein